MHIRLCQCASLTTTWWPFLPQLNQDIMPVCNIDHYLVVNKCALQFDCRPFDFDGQAELLTCCFLLSLLSSSSCLPDGELRSLSFFLKSFVRKSEQLTCNSLTLSKHPKSIGDDFLPQVFWQLADQLGRVKADLEEISILAEFCAQVS